MKATVVVVSYRPGDWLAPCLASVADQAARVVLVDNGSPGARASVIGHQAGVDVIRSPVNQGFAPAVDLAATGVTTELLALLNDDAAAGPGWVATAEEALSDHSVAAVGPKVVLAGRYREVMLADDEWWAPPDSRPLGRQVRSVRVDGAEVLQDAAGPGLHRVESDGEGNLWRWTAGRRPWYVPLPAGTSPEILIDGESAPPGPVVRLMNSSGTFLDTRGYGGDIGAYTPDDGRFDEGGERFGISGVAFVTRAATWRQLGPFADRFFAYYEDIDWCWRARLAGMKVLYDPSATVLHRRSASSGGEHRPEVRVRAETNRTLAMVRNGPRHLVLKALSDRARNGPDGGVRAGVARLLPWAVATRAQLSRSWRLRPEEVWARWAGQLVEWPAGAAGPRAQLSESS